MKQLVRGRVKFNYFEEMAEMNELLLYGDFAGVHYRQPYVIFDYSKGRGGVSQFVKDLCEPGVLFLASPIHEGGYVHLDTGYQYESLEMFLDKHKEAIAEIGHSAKHISVKIITFLGGLVKMYLLLDREHPGSICVR